MLQRIIEVMKDDNNTQFEGTTEVDEVYIGGSKKINILIRKIKLKIFIIGLVNGDTKQFRVYKV